MAKYTMELRDVVKNHDIFSFPYEFYDEQKRAAFEERFIRHFYFHEIGAETIDRFIFNLRDKMENVFPYYNNLFKLAKIEYPIIENYNMEEKTTIKKDQEVKSSGESFTAGKTTDENTTDGTETTESSSSQTGNSSTERTQSENESFEKTGTGSSETERSGTATTEKTESTDRETSETSENTSEAIKKYHDTPQGMLDLSDNDYLTTLNHDTDTGEQSKTGSESVDTSGSTDTDTSESESTESDTSESSERDRTLSDSEESEHSTDTQEEGSRTTKASFSGEQKQTIDNNTRSSSRGNQNEEMTITRHGNIGVTTSQQMIESEIKLREILHKIELLFFNECHDLFMLVY